MTFLTSPFAPDAHGTRLPGVDVRPAEPDDLAACGDLAARSVGGDAHDWTTRLAVQSADPATALFVAVHEGVVVGYGRLSWLTPTADGGHGAPDGWYLAGMVVSPDLQRRGIGTRLTAARIAWVFERADEVFYAVAASNPASRALHGHLGFEEIATDFRLPATVFGNDDGILCRLRRGVPDAVVVDLSSWRGAGA